ncbi:MAG: hypothetical protein JO213_00080 [Alphaproteobacteria bacterium]|nr:hypothetical protein [Alphaproteobacteria bacterium]
MAVGPDGFVATSVAPDYAPQLLLTEYLRERQNVGDKALADALPRLRKALKKPELARLIGAIHTRIAWIAEHEAELSEPFRWQTFLAQLARNLYSPSLPFEEADLIALLKGHREHRGLWSFGPEELLVAFIESHDLSPALADELRRYQAGLAGGAGKMKYQNQSGYQVAVAHIHLLLWHDEHDPLDPARCWSDIARRDLRSMGEAQRAAWKALFRHIKGNAPVRPAKGWITEAEKRLAQVGHQNFLDRLNAWLAPFQSAQPQALSVAGSHVLRGLLWYAALTRDPALGAVVLTLLDAKWKAKRNVDKVMVALVHLLEAMPSTGAWPLLLRLQQEWPTSSVQVERLLKKTAETFGITEIELKERALLKPKLDLTERTARIMEKLNEGGVMIRVTDPLKRHDLT